MPAFKAEEQSQLQIVEKEEIEDEEDLFEAIDKLTAHGINAGDVKKLQDAGIYTCNGLMMHTKKNLTGIKGLSEAKVDKICEAVGKIVNFGYMTGSDALLKRKSVVRITTGSQALDELLGGGIETSTITEAFGEFRSGKTQLAHTLCVSTQLPTNMNGGNGKVAYIDTEGTFRPDRIIPIAERFGMMDAGAVLDNIIYARAYTYEHQYNLFLGLAAKMAEEPFRLLIVDSVIALFRVDFTGRGELAERQQKLAQMLSRLMKIAEEFNVAVYMTNQVIADPGGGVFISDPKKPASGHVLALVLDGLLSKYEVSCHGPEKWRKVVLFLRQSLEGPLLDFIKKQIDQFGAEKSSLALKCRSIEDKIELLNKQLEASEKYKSEYLNRYQDAIKDKEKLTDDYMSRINNLQKKYSSLEEKSSNLSKTLDTARQECTDWKMKYELVLSNQKAEDDQFGAEVAMLRSKSSAAEARLGAAQEKAECAHEEAEEWKRKYDIAVRETKNALEKAALFLNLKLLHPKKEKTHSHSSHLGDSNPPTYWLEEKRLTNRLRFIVLEKAALIQERTNILTQSREAAQREEFSSALAEKEEEMKEKTSRIEEAEQRLTTLSLELKAAESKVTNYDLETLRLKLEIRELGEKVERANATALSAQSKASSLEPEKIHLEQMYRAQLDRFEEIQQRCKAAEKEAKRTMDLADEARAEATSAQKDKSDFQRVAIGEVGTD